MKTHRTSKSNPTLQWALEIVAIATDKKGQEITLLGVENLADYADYFVFVTAGNRRQVQAIAEGVESEAKDRGYKTRIEGYASGWWILLDVAGVVIHIFQPEARSFYDLDHLWGDGERISLPKRVAATQAGESSKS
ncbi:MAG: ribosome silencing factor [Planctomycetes bacterium]|nr:ribosome silencing factor [Planctomycetota bacterium]